MCIILCIFFDKYSIPNCAKFTQEFHQLSCCVSVRSYKEIALKVAALERRNC